MKKTRSILKAGIIIATLTIYPKITSADSIKTGADAPAPGRAVLESVHGCEANMDRLSKGADNAEVKKAIEQIMERGVAQ